MSQGIGVDGGRAGADHLLYVWQISGAEPVAQFYLFGGLQKFRDVRIDFAVMRHRRQMAGTNNYDFLCVRYGFGQCIAMFAFDAVKFARHCVGSGARRL